MAGLPGAHVPCQSWHIGLAFEPCQMSAFLGSSVVDFEQHYTAATALIPRLGMQKVLPVVKEITPALIIITAQVTSVFAAG